MEESIIDEPQLDIVGDGIREDAEEVAPDVKQKRNYGDPAFIPTKHSVDLRR